MNELVVSGVPFTKEEKPLEILSEICRAIKYTGGTDSIETCFRLLANNSRNRSSPSIIVKFWGADAKNSFFNNYIATRTLCTSMLGFTAKSRVYVNENLTKSNFEIFRHARDLKKDGKVTRFTTQRGRVVVRVPNSDSPHIIESLDQLGTLVNINALEPMDSMN